MDFQNMKRKQLQALCKKHNIPANLSNQEMANMLTEFLKERQDPLIQRVIKRQDANETAAESADVVVNREVKKVRFSPEHEMIEFTRSVAIKRRSRRNSVLSRNSSLSVEDGNSGEMNKENMGGRPGRTTRSRGLKSMEAKVDEKKKGRNPVNCNDEKNDASAIELFDNGELKEGNADSSGRVILLRGKMLEEVVKDASKRGRKRAKDDNSRDEKASDHVDNEKAKLIQEIVDNPGRLTRSRVQKLTEVSAREIRTGRNVAGSIGYVALVRTENDENRVASTSSFTNRGNVWEGELARHSSERVKSNGKGWEGTLKNKKIAGDNDMIEPQILLRRSKRNVNKVADSEILNAGTWKHENGEAKGLRIKSDLLPLSGETTGSEVNLGRRVVLKTEEPIKVEPRRSKRRKNLIESDEPKAGTENRHTLMSSIPQLGIGDEVSKDQKNFLQPTGVLRRSKRGTLSVKLVSADVEIKTDSALENLEAEKTGSKSCLVEKECSAVPKSTRRSKRNTAKCKSPGPLDEIERDVVKSENNPCIVAQCMKESNSKKAVPAVSNGKIAEKRKRTCRLNNPKMLEASLHNSLKIREPCLMDAQLSVSEGLESSSKSAFNSDTSAKNIISDGELTSSRKTRRKTHRKKPNISTEDSAGSSKMKLISGEEMANSDKNTASRIAELKTNFADFEDRNSASNIRGVENGHSPLMFDMKELIEQNVTAIDKNDPEAQMSSQTEDSGCGNTIEDQVLPEGLNASGDEVFAETTSSADSILLVHQTHIRTDLERADNEADKYLSPNPSAIGHVGEVQGTSVHEILDTDKTRQDSHVLLEGSNVCGKQADLEVEEAEAYKCLQPTLVDHVGQDKGISFHGILDTDGKIQENQVLSEDSNVSGKEGLAHTASSADKLLPNVRTDLKCLPPNPCVIGHVGEVQGNHVHSEGSNVSGKEDFAETVSSSDKLLPDVRTADLEVTEAGAYKCLQPSPTPADRVGQVKGIYFHEILDNDEAIQENQVFLEGSDVSGTEELSETASSAYKLLLKARIDLEVAEVEADKCLQLRPAQVDHVDQGKGISVQGFLDADEKRQDNQVLPEGSNVSGQEGLAETPSSAGTLLPDFQTDFKVAETAANKCLQPSPTLVYHVGEVKGTRVQENQDSEETRQANGIRSPISSHHVYVDLLEASINIVDNNNEDTSPNGEAGAFESSERRIDYSHSKSKVELEAPSSGMLGRLEGDNMTEGNEAFSLKGIHPELVESNEHGCLDNHKNVTCQYSEFDVHDLSDGGRSAGLFPQEKLVFSGEYSKKSSDEQRQCRSSPAVAPITISTNNTEINLKRGHEVNDHKPKKEETHIGRNINSEDGGNNEGDMSRSDEDSKFIVCNPNDAEGRLPIMPQDKKVISGEHSVKDFDDQGMFHGSPSEEPITICNFARDHETDLITEGKEACVCKDKQSESVDSDKSGCLKSRMSSEDEDWNFTLSNLFVSEKSTKITPQDRGTASAEYSINDFNEQVMLPDFSAASTPCANYNEVNLSTDISNFQETSPSKTFTFSRSQAKHPKSPLPKHTAVANTIQRLEAWSNASDTAGNAICSIRTNAKGNISQVVEGSSTDDDANHAKSGKDEEDFAGVIVGEEPFDVKSSQSWTEIEPHSLLGTTLDSDTPGQNDFFSQGTAIANLTMFTNTSTSKIRGSLTKKKEKEMENGERSVRAKFVNRSMVLPTNSKELSHAGSNVNNEENQFATPIKIVAPCNIDETCSHDRKLNRTMTSIMEFFDTMKENAATQNKSNEKVQDAGYELENSFHLGDPLSDNDVTCQELNEVESVELVPKGRYDVCEASQEQLTEKIDMCMKETSLITKDKEEKVIFLGQSCPYDEAINNDCELTEKYIIKSSGSPKCLHKLEGCADMLLDTELSASLSCKSGVYHKSEGDVDLPKSKVPENSLYLTGYSEDGNIVRETSIQTFGGLLDAEVAKVGSFRKDSTEKGLSHCPSLEASTDYGKVTERKGSIRERDNPSGTYIWDETDSNRRSSQDISEELLANGDVTIPKSLSIDYHLCHDANQLPKCHELENTCKEAKETGPATQNVDNMVAAAEHGSFVYVAVSGNLCSSIMHLPPGDHECGDFEELDMGISVFNFESHQEKKNGKEAEENLIANAVQFSIQELHFEEKVEDLNNDIDTMANVPASGCNEILEESVVADTTKEYIDSESSLSVIFENSSVSPPVDALSHTDEMTAACENASSYKNEENVAGILSDTECEDDKPSVDYLGIEIKEVGVPCTRPGSVKAVKSHALVDFLSEGSNLIEPFVKETKGFAIEFDSQKQIESEDGERWSSKQLCSISKYNARTISIRGTPGKLVTMSDMKENAPTGKSSNFGDCTAVRPAKRRALQDVAWK